VVNSVSSFVNSWGKSCWCPVDRKLVGPLSHLVIVMVKNVHPRESITGCSVT
jgi:hypothetical protein